MLSYSSASKAQQWTALVVLGLLTLVLCWSMITPATPPYSIAGSHDRVTVGMLNREHLPRSSKAAPEQIQKGKRLIFIGDIHGCIDELHALLKKVKYKPGKDHIVALGDMINKGPDSKAVVDYLMDEGASAVRGNHEDPILQFAETFDTGADVEKPVVEDIKEETTEFQLAKSFTRKQLAWLKSLPIILRIGDIAHHGVIVAVHGGMVPTVPLEDQSAFSVMNMRIIHPKTHVASEKHELKGYVPWAKYWDKQQKSLKHWSDIFSRKKVKHTTVVFGHDAKKRLQLRTYAKGLDTSCVKGNQLTAWVVGDYGENEIVQVQCEKHW